MGDSITTALSLCSGVGGLELGLEAAIPSLRTVCYVERESYAQAVLLDRMETQDLEPALIWGDDLAELPLDGFVGRVDLVCGGFPCQPWSVAGSKKGTEDERWLWDDIERLIRVVGPRIVVLENVPGILAGGAGPVLGSLAALGYDAEWGCLTAAAVGASHRRERWFCVAYRDGVFWGTDSRGSDTRTDLADPRRQFDGTGQPERVTRGRDAPNPGEGREGLADTSGTRRGTGEDARAGRSDAGEGPRGVEPERSGDDLADTELARREETGGRHTLDAGCEPEPGVMLHAPGPANLDVWARVLAEAPTLEPSFCGVADGMAALLDARADRLRACGNGVDPLQIAVAFALLADRAAR